MPLNRELSSLRNKRYRDKLRAQHPFKVCSRCRAEKPFGDFFYAKTESRYKSQCKVCNREAYRQNRASAIRRARSYYAIHKYQIARANKKKYRKNIINTLFVAAKRRARIKGFDFSISRDDIQVPKCCPVLGVKLSVGDGKVHAHSPTLDRIDSSLGYMRGNIMVISHRANTIKSDATLEDLKKVWSYYAWLASDE